MTTYQDTEPLVPFHEAIERNEISDKMKNGFPLTDAIDWFWRNFVSEEGQGFRETLIKPLAGDFDRIAHNAKAWYHIEKQLAHFSTNLTDNTARVMREDWESGKAAENFHNLIDGPWVGGLFVAEEVAHLVGKGFEQLADMCMKIAETAAILLDHVIKQICKLAKAASPWGAVCEVIEWITSGFDDFPYWEWVDAIKLTIDGIGFLRQAIKDMVETFKAYLEVLELLFDAVKRIPDLNSTDDLLHIGKDVLRAAKGAKQATADLRTKQAELGQDLADINSDIDANIGSAKAGMN